MSVGEGFLAASGGLLAPGSLAAVSVCATWRAAPLPPPPGASSLPKVLRPWREVFNVALGPLGLGLAFWPLTCGCMPRQPEYGTLALVNVHAIPYVTAKLNTSTSRITGRNGPLGFTAS